MGKIIVAEDDKFLSKAYHLKLGKTSHEVKYASDGDEVIELLKTFIPDLILLDLIMPKKDGFHVLEYIKNSETLKHIPVIVTSNLGQKEDITRALSLGAKDYIIKTDVSLEEIVKKIESFVKTHHSS